MNSGTLTRLVSQALDDLRLVVPARTRERFVERLAELLELDREQRHQARRDRAYDALRHQEH